jgi:DNA-binding MarR family transcriptional regulator
LPKESADYIRLSLEDEQNANRPVSRVFRHVLLIADFFNRVIDESAASHGLQSGDFLVVMSLHRNDRGEGMRPTELFRSLLVTSGAVTKRLDRLESMGLLERVQSSQDRRSNLVRLTPAGIRIAEAVRATPTRMHDVADRLSLKAVERLDAALVEYLRAVHALETTAEPARRSRPPKKPKGRAPAA